MAAILVAIALAALSLMPHNVSGPVGARPAAISASCGPDGNVSGPVGGVCP